MVKRPSAPCNKVGCAAAWPSMEARGNVPPMITKILFTAAVIAIVYLLARTRTRRSGALQRHEALIAPRSARPAPATSGERIPRYLAYALLGTMLAGSAAFIFMDWRDQYRVVIVRVINTNNGNSVTYQARRGDVKDRSLETIDGRRVVLASVERLEFGTR